MGVAPVHTVSAVCLRRPGQEKKDTYEAELTSLCEIDQIVQDLLIMRANVDLVLIIVF